MKKKFINIFLFILLGVSILINLFLIIERNKHFDLKQLHEISKEHQRQLSDNEGVKLRNRKNNDNTEYLMLVGRIFDKEFDKLIDLQDSSSNSVLVANQVERIEMLFRIFSKPCQEISGIKKEIDKNLKNEKLTITKINSWKRKVKNCILTSGLQK